MKELCWDCRGTGIAGHPDSGYVCCRCNGCGGVGVEEFNKNEFAKNEFNKKGFDMKNGAEEKELSIEDFNKLINHYEASKDISRHSYFKGLAKGKKEHTIIGCTFHLKGSDYRGMCERQNVMTPVGYVEVVDNPAVEGDHPAYIVDAEGSIHLRDLHIMSGYEYGELVKWKEFAKSLGCLGLIPESCMEKFKELGE